MGKKNSVTVTKGIIQPYLNDIEQFILNEDNFIEFLNEIVNKQLSFFELNGEILNHFLENYGVHMFDEATLRMCCHAENISLLFAEKHDEENPNSAEVLKRELILAKREYHSGKKNT